MNDCYYEKRDWRACKKEVSFFFTFYPHGPTFDQGISAEILRSVSLRTVPRACTLDILKEVIKALSKKIY